MATQGTIRKPIPLVLLDAGPSRREAMCMMTGSEMVIYGCVPRERRGDRSAWAEYAAAINEYKADGLPRLQNSNRKR